jgi:hypothetical protein
MGTRGIANCSERAGHNITFYDAGKVAASVSRFSEGRLRQTFGLGIVVVPRRADNILFRFYIALGSGEGSHTPLGGGNRASGAVGALSRSASESKCAMRLTASGSI